MRGREREKRGRGMRGGEGHVHKSGGVKWSTGGVSEGTGKGN